jgi:hypothetical protein
MKFLPFFLSRGLFWPAWIWIRIQIPTPDPDLLTQYGSGSEKLVLVVVIKFLTFPKVKASKSNPDIYGIEGTVKRTEEGGDRLQVPVPYKSCFLTFLFGIRIRIFIFSSSIIQ